MKYEADTTLGLFSFLVLAQIKREPEKAYGQHINERLSLLIGRDGSSGQIYVTLKRLTERGYLREQRSASPTVRKHYTLTEKAEELVDSIADWLSGG